MADQRAGNCYACGYSLAGLKGGKCPECAADVRPQTMTAVLFARAERKQLLIDALLFSAVLLLAWSGEHDFGYRWRNWATAINSLSNLFGIVCAGAGVARLLWRSMGGWAVLPGAVLGLLFFVCASLTSALIEFVVR